MEHNQLHRIVLIFSTVLIHGWNWFMSPPPWSSLNERARGCNSWFILGRYVFSIVRRSSMKCPHNIGRDSWVWGEQETLGKTNSPNEVGEEPFTERSPLSWDSVPWNGGVMVVVVEREEREEEVEEVERKRKRKKRTTVVQHR